jgi:sulfite reductase (NADPH) flavoprotein alpha-component
MEYSAKNPLIARLGARRRLSLGEGKEVCEILLQADEKIPYGCGDWLAVQPRNADGEVQCLLELLRANGEELVRVGGGEKVSLRQALSELFSIGEAPKSLAKALLPSYGGEAGQPSADGVFGDFETSVAGLSVADFLRLHRTEDISLVLSALKPLRPRLYSIASSPLVCPNGLRLVVATAAYVTPNGETRYGVSSSYLNRQLTIGDPLRCYPVHTRFKLPEDTRTDIVMVGPGVGIAPFVGFLEQRQAERKSGKVVGRNWLFFGDRHRRADFILENELTAYLRDGTLSHLDLAFSRDQDQKIYVQDRIRERGEELGHWLAAGAHFYVCGDGKRMAKDVEAALAEVLVKYCGQSGPLVRETIGAMERDRRYQRDVY